MATKRLKKAYNPLILSAYRLMECFAKSNDERDYYLDRQEGFIVYADLDASQEELDTLYAELETNSARYLLVAKMTYYESKKLMEQFVNEKVYDIDTKEKLLDIIQAKEARENFLEFLYDHHGELEKWQIFYQERSRIRIIEWLRKHEFLFVFEEDLELALPMLEKVKTNLFSAKGGKDLEAARTAITTKSKTYYSSEALNPRPKRGRPPKQQKPVETEPQVTCDVYTTVPQTVRRFLFIPEINNDQRATFSEKYDTEEELIASFGGQGKSRTDAQLDSLNKKLAELRQLSAGGSLLIEDPVADEKPRPAPVKAVEENGIEWEFEVSPLKKLPIPKKKSASAAKAPPENPAVKKTVTKKAPTVKKVSKAASPEKSAAAKKKK
jgi:hypothetical protein